MLSLRERWRRFLCDRRTWDPHNCLLFVFWRLYWRRGYLIGRKSHHGWWPHFLWSQDLKTFEEYTPAKPNHHLLIPPPLYHGVIRTTTAEQQNMLVVKGEVRTVFVRCEERRSLRCENCPQKESKD